MALDFLIMLDDLAKARAIGDWQDILLLLGVAATEGRQIDWPLVEDYLRVFKLEHKLPELKAAYGAPD
jgi:hypothetical protein